VFTLLSSFSNDGTPDDKPLEVGAAANGATPVGGKFVEVDKGTPVTGTVAAGPPKEEAGGMTRPGVVVVVVVAAS